MLYTFIDIETNSLSAENADILEFGYIQTDTKLNIIRSGNLYFYKEGWGVGATDIHGLTKEFMLEHVDEFYENLVKLYTIMHDSIIFGKNSDRFDLRVIHNFMRRQSAELGSPSIMASIDIQTILKPYFNEWEAKKTGIRNNRRYGKLTEYMEMFNVSDTEVSKGYETQLETGDRSRYHSGLYDAYLTYLATKCAINKGWYKL